MENEDGNISFVSSFLSSRTNSNHKTLNNNHVHDFKYNRRYANKRHHTTAALDCGNFIKSDFPSPSESISQFSFSNISTHSFTKSTVNLNNQQICNSYNPSSKGRPFHVSDCYVSLPHGKKYVAVNLLNQQTIILVIDEKCTECRQVLEYVCSSIGLTQTEFFGLAQLIYFDSGMEYRFFEDDDKLVNCKTHSPSWINAASRSFRGLNTRSAGMHCKEPNHPVIRQPSLQIYLRVKYYLEAPYLVIKDHVALTHYYLQLKQNFMKDCQVWDDSKCYILAAYSYIIDITLKKQQRVLYHNTLDQISSVVDTDDSEFQSHLPKWVTKQNGPGFCARHIISPICRTIFSVLESHADAPGDGSSCCNTTNNVRSCGSGEKMESSGSSCVSADHCSFGLIPLQPSSAATAMIQYIKLASGHVDDYVLRHFDATTGDSNSCYTRDDHSVATGNVESAGNTCCDGNLNGMDINDNDDVSPSFPYQNNSIIKRDYHHYHVYKLFKKRKSTTAFHHGGNNNNPHHRRSVSATTAAAGGLLTSRFGLLHNALAKKFPHINHQVPARVNHSNSPHHALPPESTASNNDVVLPGNAKHVSPHNTTTTTTTKYKDVEYLPPDSNIIWLGITPVGLQFFEDNGTLPRILLSTYKWADIDRLSFEKDRFEVKHIKDIRKFTYFTGNDERSKYLLELCKSTHIFNLSVKKFTRTLSAMDIIVSNNCNNNNPKKKAVNGFARQLDLVPEKSAAKFKPLQLDVVGTRQNPEKQQLQQSSHHLQLFSRLPCSPIRSCSTQITKSHPNQEYTTVPSSPSSKSIISSDPTSSTKLNIQANSSSYLAANLKHHSRKDNFSVITSCPSTVNNDLKSNSRTKKNMTDDFAFSESSILSLNDTTSSSLLDPTSSFCSLTQSHHQYHQNERQAFLSADDSQISRILESTIISDPPNYPRIFASKCPTNLITHQSSNSLLNSYNDNNKIDDKSPHGPPPISISIANANRRTVNNLTVGSQPNTNLYTKNSRQTADYLPNTSSLNHASIVDLTLKNKFNNSFELWNNNKPTVGSGILTNLTQNFENFVASKLPPPPPLIQSFSRPGLLNDNNLSPRCYNYEDTDCGHSRNGSTENTMIVKSLSNTFFHPFETKFEVVSPTPITSARSAPAAARSGNHLQLQQQQQPFKSNLIESQARYFQKSYLTEFVLSPPPASSNPLQGGDGYFPTPNTRKITPPDYYSNNNNYNDADCNNNNYDSNSCSYYSGKEVEAISRKPPPPSYTQAIDSKDKYNLLGNSCNAGTAIRRSNLLPNFLNLTTTTTNFGHCQNINYQQSSYSPKNQNNKSLADLYHEIPPYTPLPLLKTKARSSNDIFLSPKQLSSWNYSLLNDESLRVLYDEIKTFTDLPPLMKALVHDNSAMC